MISNDYDNSRNESGSRNSRERDRTRNKSSNHRSKRKENRYSTADKENIENSRHIGNNYGHGRRGRNQDGDFCTVEKLIQSRDKVIEIIQKFTKMSKEYSNIDVQLHKDQEQIERLSNKKRELLPFKREIDELIKASIKDTIKKKRKNFIYKEMKQYQECVRVYVELYEEITGDYNYVYNDWKQRKGRYMAWNKKLAAYCDQKISQAQQNH